MHNDPPRKLGLTVGMDDKDVLGLDELTVAVGLAVAEGLVVVPKDGLPVDGLIVDGLPVAIDDGLIDERVVVVKVDGLAVVTDDGSVESSVVIVDGSAVVIDDGSATITTISCGDTSTAKVLVTRMVDPSKNDSGFVACTFTGIGVVIVNESIVISDDADKVVNNAQMHNLRML